MKALTVAQPYAELIMRGLKRVENRTWPTSYRGELLIHAGKSRQWLSGDNYGVLISEMNFGFIAGVSRLVDCFQCDFASERLIHVPQVMLNKHPWLDGHEHVEGPWCWVLESVRRFSTPIPYRGAQGLFEVPFEVVANEMSPLPEPPVAEDGR